MPTEIERLYREHRAGLVRLVQRELHDHHEAEDVVQTAFLDAQRALERGTIPRNPPAWLAAIALNAGRRLRRRRLNAEPLEDFAVQEAFGLPELRAALASLPQEQQAAVLYRDLLGLSYGETAEQMGTSVSAVTMLLHRGRKRLRQSLAACGVGVGLWRWLKQAGMPQVAMLKSAAAVVVAAGLATTGVVAARAVAPKAAASATPPGGSTTGAARAPVGALPTDLTRRQLGTTDAAKPSPAEESRHASGGVATSTSVRPSTAGAPISPPSTSPPLTSLLRIPTVAVPKVSIPALPATVAATVTVSTPIASATVTIPTGVTATTPVTTVTVPLP